MTADLFANAKETDPFSATQRVFTNVERDDSVTDKEYLAGASAGLGHTFGGFVTRGKTVTVTVWLD